MKNLSAEAIVVGGGPVGLTAAIALAGAGIETVLIARPALPDHRTTALLTGSVNALDALGIWNTCAGHAAPLRTMRLIDDTARLLRAPEVRFDAREIGLDAFGHNIENRFLLGALGARARSLSSLAIIEEDAEEVTPCDGEIAIRTAAETVITARLVIGADGRRSLSRAAAGIESETWRYPQTALTCNLAHSRPHDDISTEFHTETGPFTLVPLPSQRSSLVFVVDPREASHLASLSDAAMAVEIERRSHSILGKIVVEPGRGVFPLEGATARRFGARRIVLVGEAAHLIPPIGAQGLNLGLRDAATVAELVAPAHRDNGDIGAAELTGRYDAMRRADVTSRTLAVDLLNRSLLSDFLPLQGARSVGFHLMKRIGPLRRAVMREGAATATSQPRLMRGEAL